MKLKLSSAAALALFASAVHAQSSVTLYGTNLTNDTNIPALNIVMKLMSCNGQPVAKLSDSSGKTLCTDETFLAYLRQVFNHPGN